MIKQGNTSPLDLKKTLLGGKGLLTGWCSMPSTVTAEMMARQGYDFMAIDIQHGMIDYMMALNMLQAMGPQTPAFCRIPWSEPGIIMKMLDAGFIGIICPMINTAEEAETFASACRYAPEGIRSYGPLRARRIFGEDYFQQSKESVISIAMIESAEGMDNLDEILAVDNLDGVYIGPADLAISLGYAPTMLSSDKTVMDAIDTILRKTRETGKIAGIHAGSVEATRKYVDSGFHFVALSTDIRQFETAISSQLAAVRGTTSTYDGSTY